MYGCDSVVLTDHKSDLSQFIRSTRPSLKSLLFIDRSRAETGGTGQGPSLWKGCIKILDGPMKTNWGLELFGLIGRARFFYKSSHWEQ